MCSPQSWRLGRTLEFALSLDTQYLCSRLEQSIAGFPDFGRVSNFGGGRSNQSILSNVAVQSCTWLYSENFGNSSLKRYFQ